MTGQARREAATTLLGSLALVALALLVLWPAAHGAFVFDDKSYVARNPLVLAPDGLRRFWTTTEALDYWPLSFSAFWAEWRLFGEATLGYHVVNFVLHGVVSALLWRLVVRLRLLPSWLAWLAAALFCLHPVNVETGAWIFQTRTTLATALGLGAALLYVRHSEVGGRARYAAALGLFVLALLAKSSVASLPWAGVVLLAVRGREEARRRWPALVPFLAASVALAWVDLHVTGLHPAESDAVRTDGLLSRLCAAARAVWFYLGKDAWPSGLGVVYPKWPLGAATLPQLLPTLALGALVLVLWALRRRGSAKATLVALGLFVGLLLPCLGFVNISFMRHTYVSDHWQYPALAVPLVWAVWLAARHGRRTAWLAAALALALVVYGALARRRAADFTDQVTFWTAALATDPGSRLARLTLATLEDEAGHTDVAKAQYLRLITEGPADPADRTLVAGAHYNLGALLAEHGNPDQAVVQYREAAAVLELVPEIRENLAALLSSLGRHAESVAAWREAVRLAPRSGLAHAGLGQELSRSGDAAGAAAELGEAVRLDPGVAGYHVDLATVLLGLGDRGGAGRETEAALQLAPTDPAAVVAGCRLRLADGKKEEALALAEAARKRALELGQGSQAQQLDAVVRQLGGR